MKALTILERLSGWLWETSWHAGVIVVLVLLAQFLLRHRLSPGWRYGLWMVLIARLLMPITPRSALSVFNLASWPQARTKVPPVPIQVMVQGAPALPVFGAHREGLAVPEMPPVPAEAISSTTTPVLSRSEPSAADIVRAPIKPFDWRALAAITWVCVAFGLALRLVVIELRFRRRLGRYISVQDPGLSRLLEECSRAMGIKQGLTIIETEEVDSPAVYGLWRKRLLLPEGLREDLSTERLRHILLHELAHIKRRDPELNWLLMLLQIAHWFNPMLWLGFARIRADRELATDELALSYTRQEERRAYGETILRVLEGLTHRTALPGLVGIAESKAQVKERIKAIARGGGPRWRWAAAMAAVVIAGIALTNAREETRVEGIDLLKKYPTLLTAGDAAPGHARSWQFGPEDIFQISRFEFKVGQPFHAETGIADIGIGHCRDGAVWAVLIPREEGKLTSSVAGKPETIAHVWLRFHPNQIGRIFPSETVSAAGNVELEERIRHIAEVKLSSSWHAGNRVMLPEPKDMTVDIDTQGGPRRFFVVDNQAQTAEYAAAFAQRPVDSSRQSAYEPDLDTNRPNVVAVGPPNGAREVEPKQDLRIRFDRPMNPHNFQLGWLAGGFQLTGSMQVSADHKEFIIPVQLVPGQEQRLVVNRDLERERWIAAGRRAEMKPSASAGRMAGFADEHGVAANEFRWSFSTKAVVPKDGTSKPRVVSVSPISGGTTPVLTLVELTFDRPMRPPQQGLPYLQKSAFAQEPALIPSVSCDSTGQRFTVPALLRADDDVRLTLKGFYSAEGVACDPVVLHYQTGTESMDPKYVQRAQAAAKDSQLQKLLSSMKQARARLQSGVETVQSFRLNLSKNSFNSLEAQTATFKWQGKDKVYADISGPMTIGSFILGSDGKDCWLYSVNEKAEKRVDRTPVAVTDRDFLLVDPFGMERRSVTDTLADADLVYDGELKLQGRSCHVLEKWEVNQDNFTWATLTQWWIDQETLLPVQIVQYYSGGWQIVRFEYASLNQSIPDSAFQPPPTAADEAHPLFFQNAPEPGERRFLRISDGSTGRMSGRIGWRGPNGTTDSGLN